MAISVFLIALLLLIFLLPRLFVKNETPTSGEEMSIVIDSFRQLTGEINDLRDQLIAKERFAVLGEVSAGIAHEFRNPMGVILGNARLLDRSLPDGDEKKEIARSIIREVEDMNRIMEELLKFAGSDPPSRTDIENGLFARETATSAGDSGNPVSVIVREPVVFRADETLLRQALRNLVRNALDTGGRVQVETGKTVHGGKECVEFLVTDTGPGIPEETLKKIFMPFFSTKPTGLGIGLSLVQKVALAHGGSVGVDSTPGTGTAFRLTIPIL